MKLLNMLALLVLSSGLVQAQVAGPIFPPPGFGGFSQGGASSPGDPGGTDFNFTGFDPYEFNALYWGPQDAGAVAAGLNGYPDLLDFVGISGATATWEGQTTYLRPPPGPSHYCTVPVYLEITVTGLGSSPWVLSNSVLGLDSGTGAVVDNSLGDDFTANLQFWADLNGCHDGVVPLNSVPQYPGNRTVSEFFGGFFFSTAPAVTCTESFNPAGKNIPKAGKGQNEDGFYLIEGFDLEEGVLDVFVENADGSYIFGPFQSGSIVKITEAPGATPSAKLMGGPNSAVAAHIKLDSDALVVAFDNFGSSQVNCLVPPPPK